MDDIKLIEHLSEITSSLEVMKADLHDVRGRLFGHNGIEGELPDLRKRVEQVERKIWTASGIASALAVAAHFVSNKLFK